MPLGFSTLHPFLMFSSLPDVYQGWWSMAYDFSLYPKSAIILLSSMFMWMTLPTPSALASSTPMPFISTRISTTHPFCIIACSYPTCKISATPFHFPTTNSCYPHCSNYTCLFIRIVTEVLSHSLHVSDFFLFCFHCHLALVQHFNLSLQ